MTTAPDPRLARRLAAGVGAATAALPATRPLVWDGSWFEPANLAWWTLLAVTLLAGAAARPIWRIGPAGLAGLAVIAALLPAAALAPAGAPGWALWGQSALLLLYAGWLVERAGAAPRLLWAGILAGAILECGLAMGQRAIVLPAMRDAYAAGELAGFETASGDLIARLQHGGVFGTFTLSNTLGAFLVALLPALAATAWRARDGWRRIAWLLPAAGAAALILTGAKGAWLALIGGAAIAALRWWRWGWTIALAAIAAGAIAWQAPAVRQAVQPSVDVRVGYWRAATAMIGERPLAGHGIGGFDAQYGRLMRPGDEPTRRAHNEPLEAAVAGGLGAGAAVAALLLVWLWRRPRPALADVPTTEGTRAAGLALAAVLAYAALLGNFASNLGWWPGGAAPLGQMLWAAGLGGIAALALPWLLRLPLPPGWAIHAGLAAAALHALIDFDLHAAGLVGTLAALAALGGGARSWALPRWLPAAAAGLALLLVAAGWWQGLRSARAATAVDAIAGERRAGRISVEAADAALAEAAAAAGADREAVLALTARRSPGAARHADSRALAERMPHSAAAWRLVAEDAAAQRDWPAAIAAAERMAACAPTDLRILRRQQAILAAAGRGEDAAAVGERIRALEPLVDARMR